MGEEQPYQTLKGIINIIVIKSLVSAQEQKDLWNKIDSLEIDANKYWDQFLIKLTFQTSGLK